MKMTSILYSFLDWALQPQVIGFLSGIFAIIFIKHIIFYVIYYVQLIFEVCSRILPQFPELTSSQGVEESVHISSHNGLRKNAGSFKLPILNNKSLPSNKKKKKSSVQLENPNVTFYQHKTPAKPNIQLKNPNVAFYQNKIPAKPNKEYIEDILKFWVGNYVILEKTYTYIQWLFPNKTPGTNKYAHVLTDEEAFIIQGNPTLKGKVKSAFEMMLDLYGMRLNQENKVVFSDKYQSRIQDLNKKDNHQFLNITRILLALKELGHTDLMLSWMEFLAQIIYQEKYLKHAKFSFETFWLETLDEKDKIRISSKISA